MGAVKPKTRRRLAFVAGFIVYFSLLWTFWWTPVVYPLKVFVVLLHELSHAIAAWATGGSVHFIELDPRVGGVTMVEGGIPLFTLSAGYLGSLAWGVALVRAAYWKRMRAWAMTAVIGTSVLVLTALFVRNGFGIGFGIFFGLAMIAAAWRLSELWNRRLVLVLGMTSCLYAVLDIKSDILDRPLAPSDAAMLGSLTGIPTLVFGVLWIVVALGVCALLVRWTWSKA
jgi:hypothetical protein